MSAGHWKVEELEAIADGMDPFRPPPTLDVAHEFSVPPPRPIPLHIRRGKYLRHRRLVTGFFLTVGTLSIILEVTGAMRSIAFYVLALNYLLYIGVGFLFIAGVRTLLRFAVAGPLQYVRDCTMTLARVLAVDRVYSQVDESMKQFKFVAGVEYEDPEGAERVFATFESDRIVATGDPAVYTTALSIGDYVPVVGLPGRFMHTAKLYGFLGVSPEHDYVLKKGRPTLSTPATNAIWMLTAGLFMLGVVLPIFLYLNGAYEVVDGPSWPWVRGTILVAVAFSFLVTIHFMMCSRPACGWNELPFRAFCSLLVGAVFGFFVMGAINGIFDRSPPTYGEIQVVEYWQETHYPIFLRTYEIEYHRVPSGITKKHWANPDVMSDLSTTGTGLAEYGQGALGMKWLRAFHPAVLVAMSDVEADELAVFSAVEENGSQVRVKALVFLSDGEVYEPSAKMRWMIRTNLADQSE